MSKPLLCILLVACLAAGCKLDESGFTQSATLVGNNGSNMGLLGKWYVKAMVIYGNISGTYTYEDFNVKDHYTFNSDYTAKISTSLPDTTFTAKYSYAASTKQLSFGVNAEDNYIIDKLTADSLIMTSVTTVTAGAAPTVLKTVLKLSRK